MTRRRVVVTGYSGVTALGNNYSDISQRLRGYENAVQKMFEWECFEGMHTSLAAPIRDFQLPSHFTRKMTRSMGPVAKMASLASEEALRSAGLLGAECVSDGQMGVAYGSCTGSTDAVRDFVNMLTNHNTKGITATTYIKMMSHTCAVNISLLFGIKGRVVTTTSACTSGSQGIGYGYEAIKYGNQKLMLAGGAEELCPSEAAVFDTLFATSTKNSTPKLTPSPFDKDRDGLVLGEGASTLILEELEHAEARGATIHAELVGFGTNCDAQHVTTPSKDTMKITMELALRDAGLQPNDIGYINGHGTATDRGDIAESIATYELFGEKVPFSTLKSYFGHTLGACGALESWLSIEMMKESWLAPTINLEIPDENCAPLNYIMKQGLETEVTHIMSNNFAFGGINTSLIFKKWNA